MRKRTVIFFVLLSVLMITAAALGFFVLFRTPSAPKVSNNTYSAVPVDAVYIQHFSKLETLTKEIIVPGGYLQGVFNPGQSLSYFWTHLTAFIRSFDPMMESAEALCSLHPSAKNTLDLLFCMSVDKDSDSTWWEELLVFCGNKHKVRQYNGQTIYNLYGTEDKEAVYAFKTGSLLVASESVVVLESSIRHLDRESSLLDNAGFARLVEQTSVSKPTRIFIPHDRIPSLVAAYLGVPMQKYAAFLRTTGQWTVLDGFITNNELQVNGYTLAHKGGEHFFSVLLEQQPQKWMAQEVIPATTLAGFSLGISDMNVFAENMNTYRELKKNKRKKTDKETITWFNLLYPTEVSLVCVPFRGKYHWIAVVHSSYIQQARIQFALLNKQEENKVMKNPLPNLLSDIFGSVFELCPATHYCYQGSFILMGDRELLNDMLHRSRTGIAHTFSAAVLQTKIAKGVMNSAGLTLFLQLSAGPDPIQPLLDKRYVGRMDSLRNYNAQYAFMQFSSLEDRMYTHFVVYGDSLEASPLIPRRREVRQRSGPVRDTLAQEKPPYKIKNHFTGKDNELFQSPWPDCRLIVRDHTGKVLWEKNMEGPVQDKVAQIDFLKNNKLQMLFAIGNRLYLIDRLGRNVSPYPKAYTTSILYGPYVFDPKGNKEYLILLVHKDNKLICYDKNGILSKDWDELLLPGYLTAEPRYVFGEGKEYWVIYTDNQTLILSKTGQICAVAWQQDCLDPRAEVKLSGPYELFGTTIEGKPSTLMLQ
ncbi:MAG: hypothetical protein GX877_01935 [Bacteroidales bacterium]|nr:hypothetical protein [Bacteroidales bacterium]